MGLAPSVETYCWLAVGGEIMDNLMRKGVSLDIVSNVLFMPGVREPINHLFLHSDTASYIWATFSMVVE